MVTGPEYYPGMNHVINPRVAALTKPQHVAIAKKYLSDNSPLPVTLFPDSIVRQGMCTTITNMLKVYGTTEARFVISACGNSRDGYGERPISLQVFDAMRNNNVLRQVAVTPYAKYAVNPAYFGGICPSTVPVPKPPRQKPQTRATRAAEFVTWLAEQNLMTLPKSYTQVARQYRASTGKRVSDSSVKTAIEDARLSYKRRHSLSTLDVQEMSVIDAPVMSHDDKLRAAVACLEAATKLLTELTA
jgi:hypothetical protein